MFNFEHADTDGERREKEVKEGAFVRAMARQEQRGEEERKGRRQE